VQYLAVFCVIGRYSRDVDKDDFGYQFAKMNCTERVVLPINDFEPPSPPKDEENPHHCNPPDFPDKPTEYQYDPGNSVPVLPARSLDFVCDTDASQLVFWSRTVRGWGASHILEFVRVPDY
jgi:hypothetical protein